MWTIQPEKPESQGSQCRMELQEVKADIQEGVGIWCVLAVQGFVEKLNLDVGWNKDEDNLDSLAQGRGVTD